MITVRLDAAAMGRVRIAVSPVMEALAWLRLTVGGRSHPLFGDPGAAARFALRDPDVRLVAESLSPRFAGGYLPDLLTPKPLPGDARAVLAGQLERVAATPSAAAAEQLALVPEPARDLLAAADDGSFAARAAAGLDRFFSVAMTESWSGLAERLDGDLRDRAVLMATRGVGALLDTLHGKLRWTGSVLEVSGFHDHEVVLDGHELVVAPTALAWPTLWLQLTDPDDAVLVVPARGLGAPKRPRGVERLIGRTRARLLLDLDVPRSTTELAARHDLSPATVSHHLGVLHEAGQVSRNRRGNRVLYHRTGAQAV